MFFTAGFETAASGVIFTILEAARNPDIQEKLRKEIEEVTAEYDGQVTFEGLQKMTYLGKFVYGIISLTLFLFKLLTLT